jgi:hypothetical protein
MFILELLVRGGTVACFVCVLPCDGRPKFAAACARQSDCRIPGSDAFAELCPVMLFAPAR